MISGPGRSGTTLLVRLLDRLGLETGADRLQYFAHARAGLEQSLLARDAPYVVKDPSLSWRLGGMLESGALPREHVEWLVVPLRESREAAASRIAVAAAEPGLPVAGGLVLTRWPRRQRRKLCAATYDLLLTAARFELPLLVLEYPRFATDADYAYRRLQPLLGSVTADEFAAAHRAVVDRKLIHHGRIDVPRLLDLRVALVQLRHVVAGRLARRSRTRRRLAPTEAAGGSGD